jgi:hypothetical protein
LIVSDESQTVIFLASELGQSNFPSTRIESNPSTHIAILGASANKASLFSATYFVRNASIYFQSLEISDSNSHFLFPSP